MSNQTLYTFKANLQDLVKLQKEIAKATTELNKLKKTDKEYQEQQEKLKGLQGQFNKTADGMKKATTQANNLNKAGGKLVNTFKSAAVAIAAAFAVRAITGSVKAIISTFTEFEAQMSAVKAISGATADEFLVLSSTALKLGASTSFTATEVGKLQEEFARLGFTVDEIDAATKSTLDLAAATGESLAKSAQIAGSTLRAFNLDASLTKNVTDVMAASFTTSALNLDRFTESMKFVAPVARAVGFSLEETTAILGSLANNGIAGSIAGNSLKNILLRLGDANSKLTKKIGGTVQGVPQLVDALKGLSEEGFSATQAVDLLDKRSAPAFLALIKNIDGLENSVDILNNAEGAVTRMAAIRLDNLQGDFTILKSATEGLSIALGGEFDTALRSITYSLTQFIQGITQSEGALAAIRTTVQLVGVALVGLTGRFAAMGLVSLYKNVILFGRGMKLLTIQLQRATTAQAALNTVTKANPFVLVISLVSTLAGAYFLLGEEASEAERKQSRLNDAFDESISGVIALNAESKKRAEAIREFKDELGGAVDLMDIELATQKELIELKDLANKQAEDKTRLALLKEENEELLEQKRINEEKNLSDIAKLEDLLKTQRGLDKFQRQAYSQQISTINSIIDKRNESIAQNETEITEIQTRLDRELSETEAYQRLKLDGEKTFREQKRKFYDDQLEDFRNMTAAEQAIFKEGAEDKLAELTWVTDYRDLVTKEIGLTGDPLLEAQKQTKAFVDSVKELGFDVTKAAGDTAKMNIELTVMERFVSLLDGSLKTAGNSVTDFGNKAGFALNKTKDQFKKLSKLMDDLIDNQFESAIKQADNRRDAEIKANQEQIALMESNIANINSISDKNDKDEIARLIKANKSKYNAIKNLTVEQYNDAIDGEKGNKDAMLEILQSMLDEEEAKLTTAFAYQAQIYASHAATIEKIQNERDLSVAGDIAEAGEQEARALERNELNFFKAMKLRRKTREDLAQAEIDNVDAEYDRQLQNLQDFYGEDYQNNEEYLRQKEELYRQSTNEINKINQDALDGNVQDQLDTINKIAEYYGVAFDAFSTFFTNKMELEKQRINEFYTAQSDDLNTSLERELEAVEGNAEAQEDVREKYALLQEANEEKKQQELRKIKKKEFQVQKMNDIIMATINGALAITKVAGQTGIGAIAAAPLMSALVAAQVAAIASQKFVGAKGGLVPDGEKFAKGGMVVGPSHADGGVKFAVGGRVAELEGGEAVINKRSTAMFRGQLSEMNAAGGGVRFADGGVMPGTSNILQSSGAANSSQQFEQLAANIVSGINSKEVIVTEASITGSQQSVAVTELTSTIF